MKARLHASVVVLSVLALALSAAGPPARAESQWPQRTVRFIVPLGPGSGVDITSRLLADRLSQKWGQSVTVENRPGGDGVIAITSFLSAHDTHVLLMTATSSFTHHPWVLEKMPYDARELIPVARATNTVITIAVPASSPIHSLKDLLDVAAAHPGKLNQANATGLLDIVFQGFQKQHGVVIEPVPYRNTVAAANDLGEGRIQVVMIAVAVVQPLVQADKVRMIALTGRTRVPSVPDVPTTAEQGFADLTFEGLVGLFGPRELGDDVRLRIAADFRTILNDPVVVQRLTATGQVVNPGGPGEFAADIEQQRAQAELAGKLLGLRMAE
jgi:tripartite-type tricarboxylate transporter receptor subunit TctC